jgi:hypothetical protein
MKRLLLAFTLACVLSGTALAGEMPGVGASVTGEVPSVSSPTVPPPPAPGEMPGVGSTATSGTGSSLVTNVLLTIITLLVR